MLPATAVQAAFLQPGPAVLDMAPPGPQAQSPYFFLLTSRHALPEILKAHHHIFMEVGRQAALDISLTRILEQSPGFAICMTTASAYHTGMAHHATVALGMRFGVPYHKIMQMETCLQEAVVNAIVHGNLGIDSDFDSRENMDVHYMRIERQLKHEPYRYRRVTVCAWEDESGLRVGVTDQGQGFSLPEGRPGHLLPHGRGLHLIQTIADKAWVDEDRRTLLMTFTC